MQNNAMERAVVGLTQMKIVKNLRQVSGGNLTAAEDAAIYLVQFGGQAVLIDSGCGHGHKRLVENISSMRVRKAKRSRLSKCMLWTPAGKDLTSPFCQATKSDPTCHADKNIEFTQTQVAMQNFKYVIII
jgi:hypothetical protein